MKKISKNIIVVLIICMLLESLFVVKEGKAAGNSYWLTGVYEDSKLVYQGNKIVVTKKWAKTSLKEGPIYDTGKRKKYEEDH